jgi:hypothetical protein
LFGEEKEPGKFENRKKYLIFYLEEKFEVLSLSSQKKRTTDLKWVVEDKSSLKL